MTARPEAILYRVLERCAHADGSAIDMYDPVVRTFLQRGLLEIRSAEEIAHTTAKGLEAMRLVFMVRARNNGRNL
jgi:hypothetical protein